MFEDENLPLSAVHSSLVVVVVVAVVVTDAIVLNLFVLWNLAQNFFLKKISNCPEKCFVTISLKSEAYLKKSLSVTRLDKTLPFGQLFEGPGRFVIKVTIIILT